MIAVSPWQIYIYVMLVTLQGHLLRHHPRPPLNDTIYGQSFFRVVPKSRFSVTLSFGRRCRLRLLWSPRCDPVADKHPGLSEVSLVTAGSGAHVEVTRSSKKHATSEEL